MGLNRRIRDMALLLDRALGSELKPYKLTMSQMRILRALSENEHLTQRALAAEVSTTESTVLITLRLMLKRGLVARAQNADDRRKYEIRMTPKGAALYAKVRVLMRDILGIAFEGMTPEDVHVVVAAFDQIAGNIRKHYHFAP
jgi:DNA-binding MarR family transcriptional regulator